MTVNDEEIELILLDAGEKMEGAVSHARGEVLDRPHGSRPPRHCSSGSPSRPTVSR